MGSSAGAMSAMCHLVSPISRGLFHRIIALSGTSSSSLMHKDRSPRLYGLVTRQYNFSAGILGPSQIIYIKT